MVVKEFKVYGAEQLESLAAVLDEAVAQGVSFVKEIVYHGVDEGGHHVWILYGNEE